MRKIFILIMAVCMTTVFASATTFAAESKTVNWLDTSKLDSGLVGIAYAITKEVDFKIQIKKDKTTYTYDLTKSNTYEYFPLQSGNGTYKITLLQGVSGNKYKLLQSQEISLKLKDSNSIYVGSIQMINWADSKTAVKLAEDLTKDKTTDADKVKAIYEYIIRTIDYDTQLASKVTSSYIPNIDKVLKAEQGICYDYSTLFAAMTRSQGIPTKLVMGTTDYVAGYHAWNSVYMNDKWVTIDTTVDAALVGKKSGITMNKDASKYVATKAY
jgi:transglutaminase-like putative cysteine protease